MDHSYNYDDRRVRTVDAPPPPPCESNTKVPKFDGNNTYRSFDTGVALAGGGRAAAAGGRDVSPNARCPVPPEFESGTSSPGVMCMTPELHDLRDWTALISSGF